MAKFKNYIDFCNADLYFFVLKINEIPIEAFHDYSKVYELTIHFQN